MENIRIDAGIKRIMVNDDPSRVIVFNPDDILFAERFYNLIEIFEVKEKEYLTRVEALEANQEINEHGIPVMTKEGMEIVGEACRFIRGKIDEIFGEGTSETAFGETLSLDQIGQFFDGLVPFIEKARQEKVAKYTQIRKGNVMPPRPSNTV